MTEDNADPAAVKQAFIDVLRENGGVKLRGLLKALRNRSFSNATLAPSIRELLDGGVQGLNSDG